MTSPATGSPASSWRTPDNAAPRRDCDPLNVRSLSCVVRVAALEKRKVRTVNRLDSAWSMPRAWSANSFFT